MTSQDEYEERVQRGYYVYGLVDSRALRETDDDPLLSIFYVGKGLGARWAFHENEVRAALVREHEELERRERRSSKAERIRKILDRGQQVSALRLSAGYVDQEDAYAAESLAIDLVGAALAAAGRPPLTNATPGHHAGFVWLREHFIFTETVELDLPAAGSPEPSEAESSEVPDGDPREGHQLGPHRAGAEVAPERVPGSSPGWSGERCGGHRAARREPSGRHGATRLGPARSVDGCGGTKSRAALLALRDGPGGELAAATGDYAGPIAARVPEPGGRTVVRYVWEIDRDAPWEYHPQIKRWGVPLGSRVREHPRLGAALYEERDGRRIQVLANYAAGVRVIDA